MMMVMMMMMNEEEEEEDGEDDLGRDYDRRPTTHFCFKELPLQILSLAHGQTTLYVTLSLTN